MGMIMKYYDVQLVKEKASRFDMERKISSPEDIHLLAKYLGLHEKAEEEFHIISLDTKNQVIAAFLVSKGSLNASIVHPREVFKRALLTNAAAIIAIHNHPSGRPEPSSEDIRITKRLVEAGELLGVKLLDHVIVGECSFYSLKAHGDM